MKRFSKRATKWLLLVVVLGEALLVWSGVMDLGEAVFVLAVVEVLLFLLVVGEVLLVVRRYRRGRAEGLDLWAALEDGFGLILPRPLAKLTVSEGRLFTCLFRWTLRRGRPREGEFGYHKKSQAIFIVMLVVMTAPVELILYEILIPWAWLRWLLLLLGIYTVFWFLGFHASLTTLPHRLEPTGLRLRRGIFAEAFVPYRQIRSVERRRRKSPGSGDGLRSVPEESAVYLAINGNTDFTLSLRHPLKVQGFFRSTEPVETIHAAADEPEKLVRELRQRLRGAPILTTLPLVAS